MSFDNPVGSRQKTQLIMEGRDNYPRSDIYQTPSSRPRPGSLGVDRI